MNRLAFALILLATGGGFAADPEPVLSTASIAFDSRTVCVTKSAVAAQLEARTRTSCLSEAHPLNTKKRGFVIIFR